MSLPFGKCVQGFNFEIFWTFFFQTGPLGQKKNSEVSYHSDGSSRKLMAVNETTTTITRAVMKDVVFHCSLSHDIVTLVWIATFRLHTAGLHKAMVSIGHVSLYVAPWLLVIGAFRSSL